MVEVNLIFSDSIQSMVNELSEIRSKKKDDYHDYHNSTGK